HTIRTFAPHILTRSARRGGHPIGVRAPPDRQPASQRPDASRAAVAELEWREVVQGAKPGDRFVRVGAYKGLRRVRPGYFVPRPDAAGSRGPFARLKRVVIGSPIPS